MHEHVVCTNRNEDLYGRGYSEAPQLTYSATLYVTQLALLMQHVGWDKANIVGISMVRSQSALVLHYHS